MKKPYKRNHHSNALNREQNSFSKTTANDNARRLSYTIKECGLLKLCKVKRWYVLCSPNYIAVHAPPTGGLCLFDHNQQFGETMLCAAGKYLLRVGENGWVRIGVSSACKQQQQNKSTMLSESYKLTTTRAPGQLYTYRHYHHGEVACQQKQTHF